MRIAFFLSMSLLVVTSCNYSPEPGTEAKLEVHDSSNVAKQIKEYGADDYGMKKYVLAFLKRGPIRDHDSLEVQRIQRAHLDNITRMADEGKLVLAGPFLDDQEIRGIYIFNVETLEEAEELTASDPAIQAGRLIMELHPWYGPAALLSINELHNKIAKRKI